MARLLAPVGLALLICLGATQTATAQPSTAQLQDPADSAIGGMPAAPRRSPEPFDHLDAARPPAGTATTSSPAESGLASPYTLPAQVVPGRFWARATSGYDSAARQYRVSSSAEATLSGPVAFRVDFDHGPSTSASDRVSFGLRLQVLAQAAHGLDLGLALFYQPNDFRREGNIVGALIIGRRFDRVALLGNALLGSDPEGDDRELDGRFATLVRINRVLELGLDSRLRSVLSTDAKRVGTSMVDWELSVLPSAILTFGPFAWIGEAGFSALQQTEYAGQPEQQKALRTGILVMCGLGAAF